jgi:NADH-quinone oxidoreductase subunit A
LSDPRSGKALAPARVLDLVAPRLGLRAGGTLRPGLRPGGRATHAMRGRKRLNTLSPVPDYNLSYFYVFVFFGAGAIFVTALLTVSGLIQPKKATPEKSRIYESGEEPVGPAWGRYPTHFYVFALLFVVFDVEVIFLFPWAVLFKQLGWYGLVEMGIFIFILVAGLFYAWRKDALKWS